MSEDSKPQHPDYTSVEAYVGGAAEPHVKATVANIPWISLPR
jgi:hypothetical protein